MSNLDPILFDAYTQTNAHYDAESGSVDECGWYAKVEGPITRDEIREIVKDSGELPGDSFPTDADLDAYVCAGGLILMQDSQGFKYVTCYDTFEELARDWARIES